MGSELATVLTNAGCPRLRANTSHNKAKTLISSMNPNNKIFL